MNQQFLSTVSTLGLVREQHHGGAVMRFIVCMYMQWDILEYVKREKKFRECFKDNNW